MGDLLQRLPVNGEIWRHTKTGNTYQIEGSTYNAITDKVDVSYIPLYACEFPKFNRQILGHPKAFLSKNDDGTPRYVKVQEAGRG